MKVEVFHAPGCPECAAARARLRAAAQEVVQDLDRRELNVLDDLDLAVEFGVITLPAIVIDGELVFTSMPAVTQLRDALIERSRRRT